MTDLFFCNLCDQSVPLARLEAGDAVRHGGRVVCPTCCDTLAIALKNDQGSRKGPGLLISYMLGLLGCVAAVFLFLQVEDVRKESTQRVNDSVMTLSQSLSSGLRYSEAGLKDLSQQLQQAQSAVEGGLELGAKATAALQGQLKILAAQVDSMEGLADGQSQLQQSLRNLQAQVQVSEDSLVEVRNGQEFLRDKLADVERKLVLAAAAPPPESGFSSQVQSLLHQLEDEDPLQRVAAVEKLGKFEDPALIPYVEALLDDSYEMNRFYAANTLGRWSAMDSVPALIRTLGDDFAFVRKEANAALVSITKEDMGYDAKGTEKERMKAVERWGAWWKAHAKS